MVRRLLWKGILSRSSCRSSCQVGISLGRVELASLRTRPLQPAMGGFLCYGERGERGGEKEWRKGRKE